MPDLGREIKGPGFEVGPEALRRLPSLTGRGSAIRLSAQLGQELPAPCRQGLPLSQAAQATRGIRAQEEAPVASAGLRQVVRQGSQGAARGRRQGARRQTGTLEKGCRGPHQPLARRDHEQENIPAEQNSQKTHPRLPRPFQNQKRTGRVAPPSGQGSQTSGCLGFAPAHRVRTGKEFAACFEAGRRYHVLLIGWLSPRTRALPLATAQYAVCAVLSLIGAVLFEDVTLAGVRGAAVPILYGGILSVGLAYTLQVVAQRDAKPTHAAILLSFESVFAALCGAVILDERLNTRGLIGCGLMRKK